MALPYTCMSKLKKIMTFCNTKSQKTTESRESLENKANYFDKSKVKWTCISSIHLSDYRTMFIRISDEVLLKY